MLPTRVLNDQLPTQKTIGLNRLKALGATQVAYAELRDAIMTVAEQRT